MIELGYAPTVRSSPVPLYMRGWDLLGQDETIPIDTIPIDTTPSPLPDTLTPPVFDEPTQPLVFFPSNTPIDVTASPLSSTLTPPPDISAVSPSGATAQQIASGISTVTRAISPSPTVSTLPGRPPFLPATQAAPSSLRSAVAGNTVIGGTAIPNVALWVAAALGLGMLMQRR